MADIISIVLSNFGLTLTSTAFMAFGLIFVLYDLIYKKKAVKVPGRIAGIEKYISKMRTGNTRSSRLMYRPVVSFIYNGDEAFFTAGLSKNTISDKIGDRIEVEYIINLPSSVRIAGRKFMRNFGILLILVSIVLLAITFNKDQIDLSLKVVRLAIPFILNYAIFMYLSKKFEKYGGVAALMKRNNPIITREALDKLDIFWSNDQIEREEKRVYKPFLFITPVLIGLVSWPADIFTSRFFSRPYVIESFNADLLEVESAKIFLNYVMSHSGMQKEFIIMSMCWFFLVTLFYSYIFTLKKAR